MSCTRAELVAALERTLGGRTGWRHEGSALVVPLGSGELRVDMREAPARRIGSLVLPVLLVTLAFSAIPTDLRDGFLTRFDLCTRRGGG